MTSPPHVMTETEPVAHPRGGDHVVAAEYRVHSACGQFVIKLALFKCRVAPSPSEAPPSPAVDSARISLSTKSDASLHFESQMLDDAAIRDITCATGTPRPTDIFLRMLQSCVLGSAMSSLSFSVKLPSEIRRLSNDSAIDGRGDANVQDDEDNDAAATAAAAESAMRLFVMDYHVDFCRALYVVPCFRERQELPSDGVTSDPVAPGTTMSSTQRSSKPRDEMTSTRAPRTSPPPRSAMYRALDEATSDASSSEASTSAASSDRRRGARVPRRQTSGGPAGGRLREANNNGDAKIDALKIVVERQLFEIERLTAENSAVRSVSEAALSKMRRQFDALRQEVEASDIASLRRELARTRQLLDEEQRRNRQLQLSINDLTRKLSSSASAQRPSRPPSPSTRGRTPRTQSPAGSVASSSSSRIAPHRVNSSGAVGREHPAAGGGRIPSPLIARGNSRSSVNRFDTPPRATAALLKSNEYTSPRTINRLTSGPSTTSRVVQSPSSPRLPTSSRPDSYVATGSSKWTGTSAASGARRTPPPFLHGSRERIRDDRTDVTSSSILSDPRDAAAAWTVREPHHETKARGIRGANRFDTPPKRRW